MGFTGENIFFDKNRIRSSFLLLIFIFLIQNLFFLLFFIWFESLNLIETKSDLVVEVKEDVFDYQISAFVDLIKKEDWITEVIYKNKTTEFKSFWEKHPAITNFLEKNNIKSPIPWVLEIYSESAFATKEVLEFLKLEENSSIIDQSEIILNQELNDRIQKLSEFVWFILWIWFLFLIWILFIIFFIIFNILHLSINHHKNDIKTFEYLWASHFFIKLPYYFESFYLMFFAFVLSFFIILITSFVCYFFFPWISIFLWWFFSNFWNIFLFYTFFVFLFILVSSFILIHFSIDRFLRKI